MKNINYGHRIISQLNFWVCPATKLSGNSYKKMFLPLIKKVFSRKFIIEFRKKGGINLNLQKNVFLQRILFLFLFFIFFHGNFPAILPLGIRLNLSGIFLTE